MFSMYSWLHVRRVDALDDEGAALLAIEERPEDEARVGARPAQPLHRSVLEQCAVRAVADDAEAVCHVRSYSRTRRLYLPICPRLSREAHWPGTPDTTPSSSRATACRFASRSPVTQFEVQPSAGGPGGGAPGGARRRGVDRLAGHRRSGAAPAEGRPQSSRRTTSSRSSSPQTRRRTSTAASATTRSGRSSTTSRPAADHTRGMAAVRRRQRAVRQRHPRALRAGLPGVDPRLPPDARPRDAAPARAGALDRLLPAHRRSRRPRCIACFPRASRSCAGVLGADYVSFQVGDYARHFRSSCLRILGIDSEPDWLEVDGRRVGIGVDPIGIDVDGFPQVLADPDTARLLEDLERAVRGARAHARCRAARLHEGDPAEAARLRALPRAGSGARSDDHDDPGARALAPREPGIPGAAGRDRAPHLSHQRPVRAARA